MTSMLVFAMRLDEASRRALEDGFVRELAAHDVHAVPSYTLFPRPPANVEEARAKVNERRFEGVLVVTMKSVREKRTYVPGASHGGSGTGAMVRSTTAPGGSRWRKK